jgi:hypothetical protein
MSQIKKMPIADTIPWEQKADIINSVINALLWISPLLNPECGKMEPPADFKIAGLLAYANGTDWDPGGTGQGIYLWTGAAWAKL